MARKHRVYSDEEKQIALIFYERLCHEDDGLKKAAKYANVEENALRFWITGVEEIRERDEDDDWEAPEGIPMPPPPMLLVTRYPEMFKPEHTFAPWVLKHYVEPDGSLYEPDFWHIKLANIAWEWTNIEYARNQKRVAGLTQLIGGGNGSKWDKAREFYRLQQEWGELPDFRITIDSVWWAQVTDGERCALVDHELRHCAIKVNPETGMPALKKDGTPKFTIMGHDFEGFAGTARRFGIEEGAQGGAAEMAAAFEHVRKFGPTITKASIANACGNCLR